MWFAAYADYVHSTDFRRVLGCMNQASFPEEMFQLHVKDFQLAFGISNGQTILPFVKSAIGSVLFVNVYLMPKS